MFSLKPLMSRRLIVYQMVKYIEPLKFRACFAGFLAMLTASPAQASADYFVDAHSQIDQYVALSVVEDKMWTHNVRMTILSTRGPNISAVQVAKQTGNNIIDAVRSKSGSYNGPGRVDDFKIFFSRQADTVHFNAAAELLIYHASKSSNIPEVIVDMHGEKVQHVLDYSLPRHWPVVIHIEFASLPANEREIYMDDLELMLTRYPDHPFLLIHMGQLGIGSVMRLIMRHENIYFMTSHADPVSAESGQPWTNLFRGNTLAPQWRNAFMHFPVRFVFAIDNVFERHWVEDYDARMVYWNNAMDDLPDDVANLIAHGNAERLWGIQ